MTSFALALSRRPGDLARRLFGCDKGVAAVEFGLISPLMLAMFAGSVVFSQAITVNRRANQISSSVADLVSRQTTVSNTTLSGYMQIASEIMSPYDASSASLKATILSVYAASTDTTAATPLVCWSYNYQGGTGAPAAGATYTALQGTGVLTAGGTSVIVAEVNYSFTKTLFLNNADWLPSGLSMSEKFFYKPRLTVEVPNTDASPHQSCLS